MDCNQIKFAKLNAYVMYCVSYSSYTSIFVLYFHLFLFKSEQKEKLNLEFVSHASKIILDDIHILHFISAFQNICIKLKE